MSQSLRNVRKEIRILGVDACNPKFTTGAIVRGGLYLDGVIVLPPKVNAVELAKEITETKYFPELKVIMIHDPRSRLNSRIIGRITALPIIQVPPDINMMTRNREYAESNQDWKGTTLHSPTLSKILKLTQTSGDMPEPVRIAHLLAKLHIVGRL